jgi:hypothetical protein
MIALLLAATLTATAPLLTPGLPPGVTLTERPMRLELRRWEQSRTWAAGILRHNAPADWWARVWPIVRREALSTAVWTRRAGPGERVTFGDSTGLASEGLPPGSYRVRACDPDTCSAWSRWMTLR